MDKMTTGLIVGGVLGAAAAASAWVASDSRTRRNVVRGTRRIAKRTSDFIGDTFD